MIQILKQRKIDEKETYSLNIYNIITEFHLLSLEEKNTVWNNLDNSNTSFINSPLYFFDKGDDNEYSEKFVKYRVELKDNWGNIIFKQSEIYDVSIQDIAFEYQLSENWKELTDNAILFIENSINKVKNIKFSQNNLVKNNILAKINSFKFQKINQESITN